MPFIENKAVFGGSTTKVIDLGVGSTFDIKSKIDSYQELTADNFAILSFKGWTGATGFDSGNNKNIVFDNNSINKSYDSANGVLKISQNLSWHFSSGTASGWDSCSSATCRIVAIIGEIIMGGVAKLLSFFIPRKWGFSHGY